MLIPLKSRLVAALLCLVAAPGLPAAPPAAPELVLHGTFTWANERGQSHELEAKLTPTGTNAWQVVWNFNWKQHPLTFTGTVQGDLRHGPVTGTGDMADGKRRFTFEGTAQDGAIKFEHYEVTKHKSRTGTGELRLPN